MGGGECSSHCRDQAAAGEDEIGKSCTKYKIILTASIMWRFKSAKKTIGNLVFNHRVRLSRKWQCKSAEVASSSTRCLCSNIRISFKPIFIYNVYYNPYILKKCLFASLSYFRNCLRTTGNTPQYVSVIRYNDFSRYVICDL